MNPMYNPDALARGAQSRAMVVNRVYNFVYGWMAVGLAISGGIAYAISQAFLNGALRLSSGMLMVCFLAELGIVFAFGAAVKKLAPMAAAALFVVFAALNGVTLSTLLIVYTAESIHSAFFITAGSFAVMALLGTVTRRDLSTVGRCCMMLFIGVLLAMVVNLFIGDSGFGFWINVVCLVCFVGLTAYDAQNVRMLAERQGMLDRVSLARFGLVLALELYLDFVNLFITIVRLFGERR